jgi:GT2 family glycosyltransferase
MYKDILPLVLVYEESECESVYKHFPDHIIRFADRGGVGSMAKAFNDSLKALPPYKYIWWITNIEFDKPVIDDMLEIMESDPKIAAVHPRFKSDHPHIRFGKGEAPFIEFTAPLIRTEALDNVGLLDEQMPYWGFDFDWSYRARSNGWKLWVGNKEIDHAYLRHIHRAHNVSVSRNIIRSHYDQQTIDRLVEKYGPGWKSILSHHASFNNTQFKTIHL